MNSILGLTLASIISRRWPAMPALQSGDDAGALLGIVWVLICLIIVLFVLAGVWKVFTKAGQPGWASIVPIYNIVVVMRIAGRPGWWVLLMFIPIVSLIVAIIVYIDLAKNFGKGAGFGIGLAFLGFIFFPILGFGSAEYNPVQQ